MSASPAAIDTSERTSKRLSPYQGLRPFREEDAEYFYGRESWIRIIEDHLLAYRLTVFYGASGVGKSSVLSAGVRRDLREQARRNLRDQGSPEIVVVSFDAWSERNLAAALEQSMREAVAEVSPELARNAPSGPLVDVIQQWGDRVGGRMLFVLDQFEEYFVYGLPAGDDPSDDELNEDGPSDDELNGNDPSDDELTTILARRDLPANFLISIREDALATLDRFDERVPGLLQTLLRLEHMDQDAAREAITGPIEKWNELEAADGETYEIEPELVDRVLAQDRLRPGQGGAGATNAEQSIDTPYLQMVMTRLWSEEIKRGSRTLRLKTLDSLGGAEEIIRARFRAELDSFSPRERDIAAEAFQYLVTPSGGKIALSASELARETNVPATELMPVLDRLSEQTVRMLAPVSGQAEPRYEIFHDVLARPVLEWRAEVRARRREKEKLKKRLLALVPAVILVLAGLTAWALVERGRAKDAEARADANRLATQALLYVATRREEAGLRSAIKAVDRSATPDAESALRGVLASVPLRGAVPDTVNAVTSASFALGSTLFVTGEADGSVRLWDLETGKQRGDALQHGAEVRAASFSRDGSLLVTAGSDEAARIWSVETGTQRGEPLQHGAAVEAAAFSPDPSLLVTVDSNGTVRVWNLEVGPASQDALPTSPVKTASFARDGELLVTAGLDGNARIWDVGTRTERGKPLHHPSVVTSAEFSPDGTLVVTTDLDGNARIWDVETRRQRGRTIPRGADSWSSAAFSPDGAMVATAGSAGEAAFWDVASGKEVGRLFGHGVRLTSAAFTPDGELVVTGGDDGVARLYRPSRKVAELRTDMSRSAFGPDGSLMLTVGTDGTARIWDLETEQQLWELPSHGEFVTAADFSTDGAFVVTAGSDGAARIWDVAKRDQHGDALRHEGIVTASFNPKGDRLVTAASDGSARVWEAEGGRQLGQPLRYKGVLTSAAFSPDGTLLAVVSSDGSAIIWDVETGSRRGERLVHDGVVNASFSPDGEGLVTASSNGTARVWSVSTGDQLTELRHSSPLKTAAFTTDGRDIVTALFTGALSVWNATTGSRSAFIRREGVFDIAEFEPQVNLLAGVADGAVSVYACDVCAPLARLRASLVVAEQALPSFTIAGAPVRT